MNRETWLENAVAELTTALLPDLPPVRVAAGWPSRGGTSLKKRVLGECWNPSVAEDGVSQIFLNPMLSDPVEILGVLVHELIHALHPDEGHKGKFVATAREVGLTGPWTSTSVGEELAPMLKSIAEVLGEYPHSKLTPALQRKVQTTRQLKVTCENCGCVVRMTRKWIDAGLPTCACGTEMIEQDA
jgi:hypothetical protein